MAKLQIIAFTKNGAKLGQKLASEFDGALYLSEKNAEGFDCKIYKNLDDFAKNAWQNAESIVFIGACGIAVRAIAPYVKDKFTDPAVITLDERGKIIIPLLSGHVGGANELALSISDFLGGTSAISTATDVNGLVAIDVWAKKRGLAISDRELAKDVSARVLKGEKIDIISDFEILGEMPNGMENNGEIKVFITAYKEPSEHLRLIPKLLNLGLGCRRGKSIEEIESAIFESLERNNLDIRAVKTICSIDLKSDEVGILQFCEKFDIPFVTYSSDELLSVEGEFTPSKFVTSITGVDNVCERSAVLTGGEILERKTAKNGVTTAITIENIELKY